MDAKAEAKWIFDLAQSRILLDDSLCGIALLDSNIIHYANHRFAQMIGTDKNEMLHGTAEGWIRRFAVIH